MLDALTAARRWGLRPSDVLATPAVGPGLSEADRLLAIAETMHSAMLCPCGYGAPHYLDETSEMDGWHEGDSTYCDVKRAADQYRKDNPEPEPGELPFVVRTD